MFSPSTITLKPRVIPMKLISMVGKGFRMDKKKYTHSFLKMNLILKIQMSIIIK